MSPARCFGMLRSGWTHSKQGQCGHWRHGAIKRRAFNRLEMLATSEIKFIDRDPPVCAVDEVSEIAARLYGLAGSFRTLDSERDQNFLVETHGGGRFILKIANAAESSDVVDFQIRALQHIATTAPSLPIPRVVSSKQGLDSHVARFSTGLDHIVYVLTYLDGALLSESGVPLDAAIRRRSWWHDGRRRYGTAWFLPSRRRSSSTPGTWKLARAFSR